MLCYRDMTFCQGDGCTEFDDCPRAFTPKVREAADRWWGADTKGHAPVCFFTNPKELSCYKAPQETIKEKP